MSTIDQDLEKLSHQIDELLAEREELLTQLRARPALSDDTLRELADEWRGRLEEDKDLGYFRDGLVVFARAVLARQQEASTTKVVRPSC